MNEGTGIMRVGLNPKFTAAGYLAAALVLMAPNASLAQTSGSAAEGAGGGGGGGAATALGGGNGGGGGVTVNNNTSSSISSNTNTANSNSSSATSSKAISNTNSAAGAYAGTGNSMQTNSVVQGTDLSRAVPTVYAPALAAAGYEVCLGSMSGGGSGGGFGFSVATTLEDRSCQSRLNAKTLATLGYAAAAREVMCQDPNIRSAMANAGTPCASDVAAARMGGCRQEYDPFSGWQTVCNR